MKWSSFLVEEPAYSVLDNEDDDSPYTWFRGRYNPSSRVFRHLLMELEVWLGRKVNRVADMMSEDGVFGLVAAERGAEVVVNDIAPWFGQIMEGYLLPWGSDLYDELNTLWSNSLAANRYLRLNRVAVLMPENWLRAVLSCNMAVRDIAGMRGRGMAFWRLQMLSFFSLRYPYVRQRLNGAAAADLKSLSQGLTVEAFLEMFQALALNRLESMTRWSLWECRDRIRVTHLNVRGPLGSLASSGPFDCIYVSLPYWQQARPSLVYRNQLRVIGFPIPRLNPFDREHLRNWRFTNMYRTLTGYNRYHRILPDNVYPPWLGSFEDDFPTYMGALVPVMQLMGLTAYIEDLFIMLSNFLPLLRSDGILAMHSIYRPYEGEKIYCPLPEVLMHVTAEAGYTIMRAYENPGPSDTKSLFVLLRPR